MYVHTHPGTPALASSKGHTREYFPPSAQDFAVMLKVAFGISDFLVTHSADTTTAKHPCTQWLVVAHEGLYFYRIKPSLLACLAKVRLTPEQKTTLQTKITWDVEIALNELFHLFYSRELTSHTYLKALNEALPWVQTVLKEET